MLSDLETTEREGFDANDDEDLLVAATYADYTPTKLVLGKKHPYPIVETTTLSSVEPPDICLPLRDHSYAKNLNDLETTEGEVFDANDDEDWLVTATYADYTPSKLVLGKKHPYPIVETATPSSVKPSDTWYTLSLPEEIIESGALSSLQLEAVTYASEQHEIFLPDNFRAGFLLGDGAGVGKGRTIAGLVYENYLHGRKQAIWVSVSNDLKYDTERDLRDVGANHIQVYPLKRFKYTDLISSSVNGSVEEGVIFLTYSALIAKTNQSDVKFKTRFEQLLKWCGNDFDGLVVFDESHRAKNLYTVGSTKPTKMGLAVAALQEKLPKARVVYASATGATEPHNMAYMTRLGIWGEGSPFREFKDFMSAMKKRGVSAMEFVAIDMKLKGRYVARQLSFVGVVFRVIEVPLTDEHKQVYDDSVKLWVDLFEMFKEADALVNTDEQKTRLMWSQFWSSHQRFFKYLCIAGKVDHAVRTAKMAVHSGKCVVIGLQSTGEAGTLSELTSNDGELAHYVSTAKGVLQHLVQKFFPISDSRPFGFNIRLKEKQSTISEKRKHEIETMPWLEKKVKLESSDDELDHRNILKSELKLTAHSVIKYVDETSNDGNESSDFNVDFLDDGINNVMFKVVSTKKDPCKMKSELLAKIEILGNTLPPNTLDFLINKLGGPEKVAEMTGRKGHVIQTEDGIQYESRLESDVSSENINLTEKQRFMGGDKVIAIISEAASSGISLQSDKRVKNQLRRVHITLELPWSADRAVQQFGRTHRSNQVNAPEYIFLISDLAGEKRFASIVAKRLESLGALTHGDRRATDALDMSQFNIDTKYGQNALEKTLATVAMQASKKEAINWMELEKPLVPPPKDYKSDFFYDAAETLVGVGMIEKIGSKMGCFTVASENNSIRKFLNRILGTPVEFQNRLFKYFSDTLESVVEQAKKAGSYDIGILDLGTAGKNVNRVKHYKFLREHSTDLHILHVERGLSWADAEEMRAEFTGSKDGYYLSHQIRNGKRIALLAFATESIFPLGASKKDQLYTIYRPNTGRQLRRESLDELEKKYKLVLDVLAEKCWYDQYTESQNTCSHAYWAGNCQSMSCQVGLRKRLYNILAGSVVSVWSIVEKVLTERTGKNPKMQVVRLRTKEGIRIVGTLIPKSCVEDLIKALAFDAESTIELIF